MTGRTETTLPDLLAHRVRTAPDDVMMVCDDESLKYAVLDRDSGDIGQQLLAAGIGKGDRVGLMMPNGIGWAVAAVGVMRIGAVLVPLSTLLRPLELMMHLRTAEISALIIVRAYRNRRYVDDLEEVLPGAVRLVDDHGLCADLPSLRRVWVWGESLAPGKAVGRDLPEPQVRAADDMAILFTSGSRGMPKGTIHTHGSALRAVAASLDARCVRPGDRLYIPMPFFWAGGFASGLLTSVVAGTTLLTEVSPQPERTIAFLKREQVSLFRGWPQQAVRIAEHPSFDAAELPHLRPGSLDAVLPVSQRARPGSRANLFGMSETFGPYAGYPLDADLPADKFGSCGKPFAGIEVKVVDPESRQPAPPGKSGEILLRGVNLMRGICGREGHDVFDADGYYPTGDVGRLDDDGFIWYEGRLDDMLKISGATVYPAEVEKGLLSCPGVAQAFVAVVDTDGRREVGAVVVADRLDLRQIAAAARSVLSSFKVPTLWLLLESEAEIPRLASDKPDIRELQRRLGESGRRVEAP